MVGVAGAVGWCTCGCAVAVSVPAQCVAWRGVEDVILSKEVVLYM